jgi:hypothetical protein
MPDHQNHESSTAEADDAGLTRDQVGSTPEAPPDSTVEDRIPLEVTRAESSEEPAPAPAVAKGSVFTRTVTIRAAAIAAAALLLIGGIAGGVIGYVARPAVATTAEYKAMQHELQQALSDTKSQLAISTNDLDAANQHISDLSAREAALTAGEAKLKTDQATLEAQTKQVQSTQFGDGIHVVGATVTPGVYSISNASNCYYAWMSGTGSDAGIIDNNIVSGPAVVTLKPGDIFETSRCGTWTKIG